MKRQPLQPDERALLDAWLGSPDAPAPERLADWLAGRLTEADTADLERALAADAGLRAALFALRRGDVELASAAELARARALRPSLVPAVARRAEARRWQPLATAALVALACGLGWMLGLATAGETWQRAASSALDLFGNGGGL